MRSVEEIRNSIKDLIRKAENEELLKLDTSDETNSDYQLSNETDLSEGIMNKTIKHLLKDLGIFTWLDSQGNSGKFSEYGLEGLCEDCEERCPPNSTLLGLNPPVS